MAGRMKTDAPAAEAGMKPPGLLARAAGAMPQGGAMSPSTDAPSPADERQATPEEQRLYETVVKNAHRLIYDVNAEGRGTVRKGVLESLRGAGNPKEGLAATAASIAKRLLDSARESGVQIDGDIMLNAGQEIVEELADLQAQAGIADLPEDAIEGAFYRAADLVRETASAEGVLDTQVFARDFKAMQEADAGGRLDAVVPGATAAKERLMSRSQGAGA
ncbi:MAG: hypothetical protein LDL44_03635 [Caenispirillum sp.]|nr:hypothetical protein [Caenispirillum sp.]